jgi:hypothetical protein
MSPRVASTWAWSSFDAEKRKARRQIVVVTHVAEALRVAPSLEWGEPHSVGHYIDLASAILGLALLVGVLMIRLARSISVR